MTKTEANLLAEVLSERLDLAESDNWECWIINKEKAQREIESILMEFIEDGSED